jgi:hypothetical protein
MTLASLKGVPEAREKRASRRAQTGVGEHGWYHRVPGAPAPAVRAGA